MMFAHKGEELPRVVEGANDALIKRVFRSYVAITILITLSATLGMRTDTALGGQLHWARRGSPPSAWRLRCSS